MLFLFKWCFMLADFSKTTILGTGGKPANSAEDIMGKQEAERPNGKVFCMQYFNKIMVQ